MINQVAFTGLPRNLYGRQLNGLTPSELKVIIQDAGHEAGIAIKTTSPTVRKHNLKIFGNANVITNEGAQMLQDEYQALTARELRDALQVSYAKYNGDGILDMII